MLHTLYQSCIEGAQDMVFLHAVPCAQYGRRSHQKHFSSIPVNRCSSLVDNTLYRWRIGVFSLTNNPLDRMFEPMRTERKEGAC